MPEMLLHESGAESEVKMSAKKESDQPWPPDKTGHIGYEHINLHNGQFLLRIHSVNFDFILKRDGGPATKDRFLVSLLGLIGLS